MTELKSTLLAAALLLGWTAVLNAGVTAAGWRWDDTQILLHAHQFSILQDFSRPEIWQLFSPANLTPWLILSFEVDLVLFGLNPTAFYVHQLLAIWAAAFLLYLCLNLWCRPVFAFAGAILFLSGLPTMLLAEQLMTRHYVEGLVFCLMALYGFVRYLRSGQRVWFVIALTAYLLAVTAKEVYVPLPALLLILPESNWSTRFKASSAFFVVTLIYAIWRSYMLNSLSGGYVDSAEYLSPSFSGEVLAAFTRFPGLLAGSGAPVLVLLTISLWVGCLVRGLRQRQLPWLMLATAFLVLFPLVPLVRSPGILLADRYLLLPWVALCFSVAWCAAQLASQVRLRMPAPEKVLRTLPWMVLPALVIVSLLHAVPLRQDVVQMARQYEVQAEFIWNQTDSVAWMPSELLLTSFWFVTGLEQLKYRITGQPSPRAVVDEIYLSDSLAGSLYAYQADCQCLAEITHEIPERQVAFAQRVRLDAPLSLWYSYPGGYFAWQFGPWQEGNYHMVSDILGVLPVPPAGQLRVMLADKAPFYLRYTSSEGWMTYSDLQHVVRGGPAVNWSRNVD